MSALPVDFASTGIRLGAVLVALSESSLGLRTSLFLRTVSPSV